MLTAVSSGTVLMPGISKQRVLTLWLGRLAVNSHRSVSQGPQGTEGPRVQREKKFFAIVQS